MSASVRSLMERQDGRAVATSLRMLSLPPPGATVCELPHTGGDSSGSLGTVIAIRVASRRETRRASQLEGTVCPSSRKGPVLARLGQRRTGDARVATTAAIDPLVPEP